jgi:hypothetical protein
MTLSAPTESESSLAVCKRGHRCGSGFAVRRWVLLLLVAAFTGLAACGSSGGSSARPASAARLAIVAPTPDVPVGRDPTARVQLTGGRVVQANSGTLRPDEGHIHVSVDGKLVAMAYNTAQVLHGLKPGTHLLQAEFVAIDHKSFNPPVVVAVVFTVK